MNPEKGPEVMALEADVVVIGGGAAGLPAAIAAKEKGAARVVLLEKRVKTGGNASMAEGIFAAGSHLQRKALIDASCDDIFKQTMKYHHFSRVNPRILRAYLNKSGGTIRWLEQKGAVFSVGTANRIRFDQLPTWHIPEGHFGRVMEILALNSKELGVQVMLNTDAQKILRDSDGKVSGVIASSEGKDSNIQIKTRSVVISTGGFGGNKELLRKYFPYYDDSFFYPGLPLTGDGIALAEGAGAAVEDFATLIKESGYTERATRVLFSLLREPTAICVNKRGERFLGEDDLGYYCFECGNAIINQPGKAYYVLFDDRIGQSMEENGFLLGRPAVLRGAAGDPIPGLREELRTDQYHSWVKVSDSWNEIAQWIGAPPDALKSTVEEYNSFCACGYDEAFVKPRKFLIPLLHPPYYAVRIRPLLTDTIGPVRINHHMEALDKQDNPVKGLYAAGVIASGWQSEEYCSEICGSAIGFSVNSGRIAGENAAVYSLGTSKKV